MTSNDNEKKNSNGSQINERKLNKQGQKGTHKETNMRKIARKKDKQDRINQGQKRRTKDSK